MRALLTVAFFALFAAGCASLKPESVAVSTHANPTVKQGEKYHSIVNEANVMVYGETAPRDAFAKALLTTLRDYGVTGNTGNGSLNVTIDRLESMFGFASFNPEYRAVVRYHLSINDKVVIDKTIESHYTSSLSMDNIKSDAIYLPEKEAFASRSPVANVAIQTTLRNSQGEELEQGVNRSVSLSDVAFPKDGTPLHSRNGDLRVMYAKEGALRKNLEAFIALIEKTL